MKRIVLFALPLAAGCTQPQWPEERPADACAAGAIGSEERVLRFEIDGKTRQALVWHPSGPGPHDVVVNLHSFRAEPRRQNHYTKWVEHAERENVILVGPDGRYATWNGGECCGKASDKGVDDVKFLDALVERIDEVGCTSGRVLATGIGNGAMMAQRWACESDVPDAVVTVGGTLQQAECPEERPIPALHYHGEKDTFMPMDGSKGHRPVSHATGLWTKRNGAGEPQSLDAGQLSCKRWEGQAPTVSCTVAGAYDGWPGAADQPVDSPSPLADATVGGWAFVKGAWDGPAEDSRVPRPARKVPVTPPEGAK